MSYEIQPTLENIYQMFIQDSIGRNKHVYKFIERLNDWGQFGSFALDGAWGSGKTFFVLQVKMVLDALNGFIPCCDDINDENSLNEFQREEIRKKYKQDNKPACDDINLHYCLYYDCWEHDDEEDPVSSLVYEIAKCTKNEEWFSDDEKIGNDIFQLISRVIGLCGGRKFLASSFSDCSSTLYAADNLKDLLHKPRMEDELRKCIKEFLDLVLQEKGDRLVIFLDELDRCRPDYAIRLLERIKHYFGNERIIFVFSTNIAELQQTVRSYYGYEFDAGRYLEKFFTWTFCLPPCDSEKYIKILDSDFGETIYDRNALIIMDCYNLGLREKAKYVHFLNVLKRRYQSNFCVNFDMPYGNVIAWYFIPLMAALIQTDHMRYYKFVSGDDFTPIIETFDKIDFRFYEKNLFYMSELESIKDKEESEEKLCSIIKERLIEVYNNLFGLSFDGTRNDNLSYQWTHLKNSILEDISLLSHSNNSQAFNH